MLREKRCKEVFSVNSRLVVGFCVDKEEDAKLLEFLNSKKNKSEFIRSVLYNNLEAVSAEKDNTDCNDSMNKILLDVLSQITMLTNRLLGCCSFPSASVYNHIDSKPVLNNEQYLNSNVSANLNELSIDANMDFQNDILDENLAEEHVFGAVMDHINNL